MEVLLTHAKPRLVRLAAFRVGPRPERQTGRVRDEILAVLPELVDEWGEFTMSQVMARLNPDEEERRGWAVRAHWCGGWRETDPAKLTTPPPASSGEP